MRLPLKAVVALGAGALFVAGCTPEVPALPTAPPAVDTAAVLPEKAERIMAATFLSILDADEARDASVLSDRVGPDIVTMREAHYLIAAAEVPDYAIPAFPADIQEVYTSANEVWPRVLVGVSEKPSDDVTPVLYIWVQDSVETNYQLRGFAHMIPGAVLPEMPGSATGAPVVDLDDPDSLSTTPRAAMSAYVGLLRAGSKEDPGVEFGKDAYRDLIFETRATLTDTADTSGGTYLDTVSWDAGGTFVIRASDGGVLIFAPLKFNWVLSAPGTTLSVPGVDIPLLGDAALGDTVAYGYLDFVVLHVPAEGGTSKPGLVAGQHSLVSVTNGETVESPSPSPSPSPSQSPEDDA